jgi:predicted DNA-binding WGR domain protein
MVTTIVRTPYAVYLWYHEPPRHDKVWTVEVVVVEEGAIIRRQWGRRSKPLQQKVQSFEGRYAVNDALHQAETLVEEKTAKGYVSVLPEEIGLTVFKE